MGERLQPGQAEKAARALDGVNQAEDVIEDLGVVRLLLEPHQLIVDGVEAFARLRQKLPQQIVHVTSLQEAATRERALQSLASFPAKRLSLVEQTEMNGLNKEITRRDERGAAVETLC